MKEKVLQFRVEKIFLGNKKKARSIALLAFTSFSEID